MKIILDADACPAVDLIADLAKKYNIRLIVVSDYHHIYDDENLEHILVPAGENSADFKIISLVRSGDIVVTQDHALAAILLAKNARVISPFGKIYNSENIDALLATRHIYRTAVRKGERIHGRKYKKRSNLDDIKLIESIKNLIEE